MVPARSDRSAKDGLSYQTSQERQVREGGIHDRASSSESGRRDAVDGRVSVDPREAMFVLRGISVSGEVERQRATQERGSPRFTKRHCFDLLLLPGWAPSALCKGTIAELELVMIHRSTLTAFSCSLHASALANALLDNVYACLVTPTSLSADLEQSSSSHLREIIGRWLHYRTTYAETQQVELRIGIPGSPPVQMAPFVGHRRGLSTEKGHTRREMREDSDKVLSNSRALDYAPRLEDPHRDCLPNGDASDSGRQETHDKHGDRSGGGDRCERSQKGTGERPGRRISNTTTLLQAGKRNERFVFRRIIPVPVRELSAGDRPNEEIKEEGHRRRKRYQGSSIRYPMVVCVYEAFFTSPTTGRILRELRIHAREEGMTRYRAREASTRLPWHESCAGIEGGRLCRLVQEGSSLTITRREGDSVEHVTLQVSVPSLPSEYRRIRDDPQSFANVRKAQRTVDRNKLKDTHGIPTAALRGRDEPMQTHTGNRGVGILLTRPTKSKESCLTEKVYEGWHSITGMRLHVLCYQETPLSSGEDESEAGGGRCRRRAQPAGRGGARALPRGATLRILLCDPQSGVRHEVRLCADKLREDSLLETGGIIDNALLDPGRRPTLAKAIVRYLRLVFDEDGQYNVILATPAEWARPCHR